MITALISILGAFWLNRRWMYIMDELLYLTALMIL